MQQQRYDPVHRHVVTGRVDGIPLQRADVGYQAFELADGGQTGYAAAKIVAEPFPLGMLEDQPREDAGFGGAQRQIERNRGHSTQYTGQGKYARALKYVLLCWRCVTSEVWWVRCLYLALALYCLFGSVQIRQKPGLQYDEAMLVLGAVHMRHLPHEELNLAHDPNTWVRLRSRWFPLMTVRYVGAVKEYLAAPLFAFFGPRTSLIRLLSMGLGLIGIWGIASLLRAQAGARVAALAARV